MVMPDTTIIIKNCNNIISGEIVIYAEKLIILFGRNGTGKSTIARAIGLLTQNKSLTELLPYGVDNKDMPPTIDGVSFSNIAIFNDEYVSQYVYQPDTLIIVSFNGSSVDRDNIADLESKLTNMKVDLRACDTYFILTIIWPIPGTCSVKLR
jgi:energy-coupling factor transporter ATP-binding protein EcfA2